MLNNLGYHDILLGDYAAARQTLSQADPKNPYISNKLALLVGDGAPPPPIDAPGNSFFGPASA